MTRESSAAELRELVFRYAFAIDRGKSSEVGALFSEDGVLKTPGWTARGRDAIVGKLLELGNAPGARPQFVRHHVTNWVAQSLDEARATGRAYYLVLTQIGLDHAGVYVDAYVRIAGQWLIREREVRLDWASPASVLVPRVDEPRA